MNVIEESVPWASFCLATYRRPERLRTTLRALQAQTFSDFEIVVSDNDPEQSGREIVESFGDRRVRYFSNAENVGMVKNFNIALSHARGRYVVMITDDDPPYPTMLATLEALTQSYPGYGAYYGACEVLLENSDVAGTHGTEVGRKSFTAAARPGSVRTYDSGRFLRAFFGRRIFRYMLWSTGIVDREIALYVGGMPDYGSPFLTDFGYMALAGAQKGFVAINSVLGYQVVHGQNAGFVNPHALHPALHGFHGYLSTRLGQRSDWNDVRPRMERFLGIYIVGQIVAMERHFRRNDLPSPPSTERFASFAAIPYVRRRRLRYLGMTLLLNVRLVQRLYWYAKKLQFGAVKVWGRVS